MARFSRKLDTFHRALPVIELKPNATRELILVPTLRRGGTSIAKHRREVLASESVHDSVTHCGKPPAATTNDARRPLFARDPFFAVWAHGDPARFSESWLSFCDSTGEHVRQLPCDMEGDFATPAEFAH